MIIVQVVGRSAYGRRPRLRVRCEGCGDTLILSAWKREVTPDRKCHTCAGKERAKARAGGTTVLTEVQSILSNSPRAWSAREMIEATGASAAMVRRALRAIVAAGYAIVASEHPRTWERIA